MPVDYETETKLLHDKVAWQQALNLRTCPPDRILFGEMTPLLAKHLRGCFICQKHLKDQEDFFNWKFPEDQSCWLQPEPCEPGQVRLISTKLAGWGPKNRYYHPPFVFILECIDAHASTVAQIYPGDAFMGPLDVNIEGTGYIEPWNIYTIGHQDLGNPLETHPEIVSVVKKQSQQDFSNLPSGYFHDFFYALEIEVGSFFSQLSLAKILSMNQPNILCNPEQLRNNLISKGYSFSSDELSDPRLELARLSPKAQGSNKTASIFTASESIEDLNNLTFRPVLRMAAAERKNLRANVILQQGSDLFLDTIFYSITACETEPDGHLFVSGELLTKSYALCEIMAWWETNNLFIPAIRQELSPDKRFFELVFGEIPREKALKGQLVLLLSAVIE